MRLTASTRLYAVLGHPVRHSLSPLIQNAAFEAAGKDAAYVALEVRPGRLGEALRGLHAAGVLGLNLTTPHKEAVGPFLSGRTAEAERAGAANTLRWVEEGWLGHATDGPGFADWVRALGIALRGGRVLVLGAGGAARSIAPVLPMLGAASVGMVSRDGGRARAAAARLREYGGESLEISAAALGDTAAAEEHGRWDLLVRALASDTIGTAERSWWRRLSAAAPVLELNYGPRAAGAREVSSAAGRRFEDGLGLLLHQGAHSFTFWTGEPAPVDAMRAAIGAGVG